MIKVEVENGLAIIWDDTLEENGWIIKQTKDHDWALWDNLEFDDKEPFRTYRNHELPIAILQGQKWT